MHEISPTKALALGKFLRIKFIEATLRWNINKRNKTQHGNGKHNSAAHNDFIL
jgi:hypothetical protein